MRAIAWVACCAALGALAEGPGDFASSASITPQGSDALQRFVLPFAAYRDMRRDMADVRVFNGRGEPVPIAVAAEADPVKEAARTVALPQFAISKLDAAGGGKGTEVTVRTADGTLVEVRGRGAGGAKTAMPTAYLLDASHLTDPLASLVFDWNAAPGTEVVRVSIEESDDLQAWHHSGHGTLLRVSQGGNVLEQTHAALHGASKAKYYRVTWSGVPSFALKSVQGEYAGATRPAERATSAVPGAAGPKPGEFVFDLGARLPVEALRVVPAEPNSVATFTLLARDTPAGEWRPVTSAVFYRLERGGTQLESGAVEIGPRPAPGWAAPGWAAPGWAAPGRTAARYWMARVDPRAGGVGSTPPALEVQWRSAQVIFAARGPGPFRLAFGNPEARPVWASPANLMPGYHRGDELRLPEASVGPVEGAPPAAPSVLPAFVAEVGARKIALWSILVIGVLVLGAMAWRLSRQMKEGSESGVGVGSQSRGPE